MHTSDNPLFEKGKKNMKIVQKRTEEEAAEGNHAIKGIRVADISTSIAIVV